MEKRITSWTDRQDNYYQYFGGGMWVNMIPTHIQYETHAKALLEQAKEYFK
ncbi:hypothetical protein MHH81_06815 [Psychrobacillus sp. FSL H8-0484]|uniref:hypothetical protein n=1 Tax=Psychrobacillus sp. FSL H8-0484 TaxID=2921390 RepID=UPI0030FD066F